MALDFVPKLFRSPWTDERIDTLRTLYASGISCSQIAEELGGVTRNGIIGKIHRLKLTLRGNRPPSSYLIAKRAALKQPRRIRLLTFNKRKSPTYQSPPIAMIPTCEPVNFKQLEPRQCKFPVEGTGEYMLCCGADQQKDSPYCTFHHRQCHAGHVALGPAEAEIRRRLMARRMKAA